MSLFTILWIGWIAGFFLIEGAALAKDDEAGTLSDHFRLWFDTKAKPGRMVWMVVSGIFFAWFTLHIAMPGLVWP